jgi:hypothetical protein
MIDCVNSEIRDLLPERLAGGLGVAAVARVDAHLATCAACRAELELLGVARRALAGSEPAVDVARISASMQSIRYRRSGWNTSQWRIAAGLLIAVIGAGAVGSARQLREPENAVPAVFVDRTVEGASVVAAPAPDAPVRQGQAKASPVPADDPEITVTTPIGTLSEDRLAALIADIEQIQAVPLAEPQIRAIPVGAGAAMPDSVVRLPNTGG